MSFKLDLRNKDFISEYFTNPYEQFRFEQTLNYGIDIPTKIQIPKNKERTKFRTVYDYPELSKTFFKILNDIFCSNVILNDNTMAYRKGYSIGDAIKIAKAYKSKDMFLAKVDIVKYFNSVKRDYLCNKILPDLFTEGYSLDFMKKIMNNTKCYCSITQEVINEEMGIQPGNPFSSFLANYILNRLDIEMTNICKGYLRYSDDILVAEESLKKLNDSLSILQGKLYEIGLEFNPDKLEISKPNESTTYLGTIITKDGIGLTVNKKKDFKRTVKSVTRMFKKPPKLELDFPARVKECFTTLMNRLFEGITYSEKSGGLGGFIINNCTNENDIKELNDYLIQEFKVLKTGKHNKATWHKTTLKELTTYGFYDWYTISKKYKNNRAFFANDLYMQSLPESQPPKLNTQPYMKIPGGKRIELTIKDPLELIGLLYRAVKCNNSTASIGGYRTSALYVDVLTGEVSINSTVIVKDYKINPELKELTMVICSDEVYNLTFDTESISVPVSKLDKSKLFMLFEGYCYRNHIKAKKSYRKLTRNIQPTMYDLKYRTTKYTDRQRDLLFFLYLLPFYNSLKRKDVKHTVITNPDDESINMII